MDSLMPLVPEKTFSVCTNGLKTGEVIVTNHFSVKKANGYLIATKEDKPTNMACVYAGLLIAIVGGLLVALFATGVGAVLGGLLLAALAGILAAYGLGGLLCYFCLKTSQWDIVHPFVIIEGKEVIIGSSKTTCFHPLSFIFSPGDVQLFYSKEAADEAASIYRTKNIIRIFDCALLGWGIPKLIGGIIGSSIANTLFSFVFGKISGDLLQIGEGYIGDVIANSLIPVTNDVREYSEQVDDVRFSNLYKEEPITITESLFNKITCNEGETTELESPGSIIFSTLENYNPYEFFKETKTVLFAEQSLINAIKTHQQKAITIENQYGTPQSITRANNSVAIYGPDGVTATANRYVGEGMKRSDAFKRAWAEYHQANNQYVNEQMAKKTIEQKKNDAILEKKQQDIAKQRQNAKVNLSVIGLSVVGDTLGEIISSLQENSLKNRLPEIMGKESDAMQKVGIFEKEI